MKETLGLMSVTVGASAYLYLVIKTSKGSGEGVSLTTFLLWTLLALISGFTMKMSGANPAVLFIYAAGAGATTLVLFCKGRNQWSSSDTLIAVLVFICLALWYTMGVQWALGMSVLASSIAAKPLIQVTWENPLKTPVIANAGFLTANTLSFLAAETWAFEKILYPGVNIVVCSLLVYPWIKAKRQSLCRL